MKSNMHRLIPFVAFLLSISIFASEGSPGPIPNGWRLPLKKEMNQKWRDQNSLRFKSAKGDFDGDGKIDEALILVDKDGKKFGIFVWWAADKFSKAEEVYVEKDFGLLQKMGIGIVKKGTFKTACGKGYYDCAKDDSAELTLSQEGIDFFMNESANSFFHWDSKTKSFERTWMSD